MEFLWVLLWGAWMCAPLLSFILLAVAWCLRFWQVYICLAWIPFAPVSGILVLHYSFFWAWCKFSVTQCFLFRSTCSWVWAGSLSGQSFMLESPELFIPWMITSVFNESFMSVNVDVDTKALSNARQAWISFADSWSWNLILHSQSVFIKCLCCLFTNYFR